MKKLFIGIDVSKEKVDICLLSDGKIQAEDIVKNTVSDITKWLKGALNKQKSDACDVMVCAEHTGQYTYRLVCACESLKIDLWLENPLQIKRSFGAKRGKDDKTDARRIAEYAWRFADKAQYYKLPDKKIASLRQLISERDLYLSDKAKYQGQLTDQKGFMSDADYRLKSKRLRSLIKNYEDIITAIDEEIEKLINEDDTLRRQSEILQTIPGVGKVVARKMIAVTNSFKNFDDSRKLCCHVGVAPFQYTSGSSVHSKNRVSKRADRSTKSLLHMAALSAIRCSGEFKEYFNRKVAEGKNKMLIINNIRAKIVLRMFALISKNEFYNKNYSFSLA